MKLEVLKCPSCGANIEIDEHTDSCECEYCGATITIAQSKTTTPLKTFTQKTSQTLTPKSKKPQASEVLSNAIRKVFNAFFIAGLFLTGFSVIMFLSDMDAIGFGIVLSLAIYTFMFKVLSLTPKKSKHILGKTKGLKPIYFVLLCILLSFAILMTTATASENSSNTDTTSDTTITTSIDTN